VVLHVRRTVLDGKDVVGGLCPDCKRPIERAERAQLFFQDGAVSGTVDRPHPATHEEFIRPVSRRNEVLGFLQTQKLGDLSISRPKSRLSWGIELPFDKDYVTYVWFDALVNYVSALEYKCPRDSSDYWPADAHLVGKDILTTHAVYWSTMLMALERPLPDTIFAHGWWTVDGEKMSKSRGNVVDPNKMVDQFGADAFRYFLLREVPFGQDGDFSHSALVTTVNAKLANGIGNLLSRTLTMIERSCAGVIPDRGPAVLPELEQRIEELAKQLPGTTETGLNALLFRDVLLTIEELNGLCDEYIDKSAPWKLAKQPEAQPQLHTVLNTSARALRLLALLLYPFMPNAAAQMLQQLGLSLDLSQPLATPAGLWDAPLAGCTIQKGASLFPRIESKPQGATPVSETPAPQQPTAAAPTTAPAAPPSLAPATAAAAAPTAAQPAQIGIDDFMKIQLKAAKVCQRNGCRNPKSCSSSRSALAANSGRSSPASARNTSRKH
jgi:methionyl-tRNA synthetase